MKKLIFGIILYSTITSCSSDPKPTENKTQDPIIKETIVDSDSIQETPAIDTNWNFYAGTAGLYDSQIVMELTFIDSAVYGNYWYSKHKKRLTLTGTFNEKDQKFELDESYKGELTGRITFSIKDNELVGRWYAPKSTGEGESFYCEKVVSDSKVHLNPVFSEYEFKHKIEVYDFEEDDFKVEDAGDYCTIVQLGKDNFIFDYSVIGHNYHLGMITGNGTMIKPDLGQFMGEEGCEVLFKFYSDSINIDTGEMSCRHYAGHRAYFGGTLVKTN